MFGRNSQNIYSSGTYNSNNYSSGSYNSNSSYSAYRQNSSYNTSSNSPKLGSYRVKDYDSQKLFEVLAKVQQFRQFTPTSISLREETIQLSPIQLRAEDYYMMRNKALNDKHWRALESCMDKRLFNKDLLSQDSMMTLGQLLSFNQSPLSPQNIQKLCNGNISRYANSTSPYGSYSQQNYNSTNNNYSSTSNNMFTSNNNNNTSNNPFSSNNNMNSSSYNTRSNPFSSNNSNSNNMFTSNNNNGGNMFSSRTNDMYGSNSNGRNMFGSNSNNPFTSNNNTGGSNSNNPFTSNNNNNNSNSNNMFASNNNNNNNSNNMFTSNRFTNNNSNPFTNNNNNNNNNSSNNMFNSRGNNPFSNNNNTNNNNNNNMFTNNNNNNNMFNRGNNLFANNNNNNNNSNPFNNNNYNNGYNNNYNNNGYNPNFNSDMNGYAMLQMAHLLKQCADKIFNGGNTGGNSGTVGNGVGNGAIGGSLYGSTSGFGGNQDHAKYSERLDKKYAQWFTDPFDNDDTAFGYRKKSKMADNKTIVIVKEGSNSIRNGNSGSFIKKGAGIMDMHETLWDDNRMQSNRIDGNRINDSVSASQHTKFYTSKTPSFHPSPTTTNPNAQTSFLKRTLSSFHPQQPPSNPNVHLHSSNRKQNQTFYASNSNTKNRNNMNQLNGVRYRYQICCLWGEYLRNVSNQGDYDKEEFYVEGEVFLEHNPALIQLTQIVLNDVVAHAKEQDLVIRRDASLKLEFPNPLSRQEYAVKGTLVQNKINVGKGYSYIYNNLEGWEVTNLTISNKLGSIKWPGVINIKQADFQKDISIVYNEVDITGPLEEYDKQVTLNSLPKSVQSQLPDEKRAAQQMQREIRHVRKNTNNDGINLIQLDLKNKFYTIRIDRCNKETTPAA